MRIGVDATSWANGRGYGRFTRQMLPALAAAAPEDELICFLDPHSADRFDLEAANVRRLVVAVRRPPTEAAATGSHRSLADMLALSRAVARERPEVFFSPTVYTFFPLPLGLRAVITVHDAIAERFPRLTLPTRQARLFWWLKVRLALAQARLVLTVSEFAARELVEVLGVRRSRLRIALEAAAPGFRPSDSSEETRAAAADAGLPAGAPWFIYVGGFNPHKHLEVVVKAHAAVATGPNPPHLVLVGATDGDAFYSNQDRIRESIESLGTGSLVHWAGFVPDPILRHLYSGAIALLLPSASEGFGLPAVEAAACGAPVVATTASPLPELLAGGGLFVGPGDLVGVERAMRALLDDPAKRTAMAAVARQRASSLTWERGARSTLAAIREAAA